METTSFKTSTKDCHISFHSLNYTVKTTKYFTESKKKILHNVSGLMKPGLNAIMGPSGSGKTTLLNLLAGRVDKSTLDGKILIDGKNQPENFKFVSGFVTQDDIVMGTLTVEENLMFSADMRLPESMSRKEKKIRVESIMKELGISSCANSKVGTELRRGISGGERKRTNIGMELIISPKVLFLDEPTTGLDSSTALAVIHLLKTISQTGKTIIFSIHQPCFNIFKLFDSLMLLSSGRVIYHGSTFFTFNYFKEIGYECEEHNNPADYFLDLANADATVVKETRPSVNHAKKMKAHSKRLQQNFLDSVFSISLMAELDRIERDNANAETDTKPADVVFATSFWHQMRHLSMRSCKNILRDPVAMLFNSLTMAFLGILIGIIFFRIGDESTSAIQDRTGFLFFLITVQTFRNIASISLFIEERVLFKHESTSGFYRVSVYFFAKVFFDIIPMRVIPTILLSITSYFLAGLQLKPEKFFIFFLSLVLSAISSAALTFAVCTGSKSIGTAHVLVEATFIYMETFGGYIINVLTIPGWLRWLEYVSIFRYTLKALFVNELVGLERQNSTNDLALKYLEEQDIAYKTTWDLWQNHFALLAITIGFLLITYIQLWQRAKNS